MGKFTILFQFVAGIFSPDALMTQLYEAMVDLKGDLASGDPNFALTIENERRSGA